MKNVSKIENGSFQGRLKDVKIALKSTIFQSGRVLMGVLLLALLLSSCKGQKTEPPGNAGKENNTLTIWWERGYYPQEDQAIESIVADWQRETGKPVDLILVNQDDFLKNINSAFQSGNAPDIMFSILTDEILNSRWAREGKLADVSEVVEPVKELYSSAALRSVRYQNDVTKKRSTYAVPMHQRGIHVHYWRELLTEADLSEDAIPESWDAFWAFWKQAQDRLRAKGDSEIYAFGLPMSSESSDTHYAFEKVLDAYDVELWDEEGNLRARDAGVREGVIAALEWYANLYREGYVPPDAIDWTNGRNNTTFLNQQTLMVVNPTLSIPASQREDKDVYQNQIVTTDFPEEPDGEALKFFVAVKQVALFESSSNKEAAKEFLSYLIQPENLGPYLESSLGRYFPVMPELSAEPFWNDPADPHVSAATQQFQKNTAPHGQSVYLLADAVWGQALERILVDGLSVEESADEAIARIEEIFKQKDK